MNIQKKDRITLFKPRMLTQTNKNKKLDDKVGITDCAKESQKIDKLNNKRKSDLSDNSTNTQTQTEETSKENSFSLDGTPDENSLDSEKSNSNDSNSSDFNLKISDNDSDTSVSEKSEQNKKFEIVLIKNETHETVDNSEKNADSKDSGGDKEGEPPTPSTVSNTTVSNKTASSVVSPPPASNRVFIIKNLAGKSVTIIPKSTPVVLNKDTNTTNTSAVANLESVLNKNNNINKQIVVNISKDGAKTVAVKNNLLSDNKTVVLKLEPKSSQCKNLIKNLPNTGYVKIGDLNKSQKYFAPVKTLKLEKTESVSQRIIYTEVPKQCKTQIIDLTEEDDMKKNETNKMPNFSKILQVLTASPANSSGSKSVLDDTKIPIYVDCQTQTENLTSVKDIGVQTEVYMPSPTRSIEDLPNITELLKYVFSTPEYSTGLDEIKKNDLIDMSKNIVVKGKTVSHEPKGTEELKKQLFLDLKDCATFDFLGHKPIHNAVLENNLGFLKRQIFALRIRKISLDIENNSGQTALQIAVSNNCNIEIITTLLGNGASANILDNEGNNLIHLAVINSTHFILEVLLKYLVDPVKEINRKNDEGLTPLMIASIDSKPEIVDMLLRNRADPNLRDEKSGRTALFHAVELNCNYVINLLLKYKADPKVRNYFGLTALDAAKDLDISDSKILESEKEVNSQNNQTSVIVNMNSVSKNVEKPASTAGNKRGTKQNGDRKGGTKKSKLSFVPSLMKVEINDVKNASSTKKRRK